MSAPLRLLGDHRTVEQLGPILHRFIGSVHLAAILLIGLGGEWLWRRLAPVPDRWRALALALVVLALLVPALRERRDYDRTNASWMARTERALDGDTDARAILQALRDLPPGRTYAGLPADWGKQLSFGDVHFYDLLLFNRVMAATRPYGGISLNADIMWHFDDHNPAHYDLLNVRYLVAPRTWQPPAFLRPIKETRRYVLYETPTHGYGELAAIAERVSPPPQSAMFFRSLSWFEGPDPAARTFLRYDFPPGAYAGSPAAVTAGTTAAGAQPGCPDGKTDEERIAPERIDLRVECPASSTLVLKVTYHPNWRVTVGGHEAPTFMVSPSFIGVNLPPGAHSVRAEYRSGPLKIGLLILSGLTLLAVILFRRGFAWLEMLWAPGAPRRPGRAGDGR